MFFCEQLNVCVLFLVRRVQVTFPIDHAQKRPRGFAFVEFETVEAAAKAIDALNMQRLNGRAIAVRTF